MVKRVNIQFMKEKEETSGVNLRKQKVEIKSEKEKRPVNSDCSDIVALSISGIVGI